MKSISAGTRSGCLLWGIVVLVMGACLLPIGFMVSSFTAESDLAIHTVGPIVCPKGTNPKIYSYQTTSTDENGFPVDVTAYELHCLDSNGAVVKNDPSEFGFLWNAIGAGITLLITAILGILLAAPIAVLMARVFKPKTAPSS